MFLFALLYREVTSLNKAISRYTAFFMGVQLQSFKQRGFVNGSAPIKQFNKVRQRNAKNWTA